MHLQVYPTESLLVWRCAEKKKKTVRSLSITLKAPLVGEPGRYQIMAYMERNTNFSIEAHTRPKRGMDFAQGGTPDFKWPGDNRIGAKIKTPEKKNPPAMDHNLTPPSPPPHPKKKKEKNNPMPNFRVINTEIRGRDTLVCYPAVFSVERKKQGWFYSREYIYFIYIYIYIFFFFLPIFRKVRPSFFRVLHIRPRQAIQNRSK